MKIIKPVILSIFAVIIAVLSSVASYIITASILKKEPVKEVNSRAAVEKLPPAVSAGAEVKAEENDKTEAIAGGFKYYMVKLEGDKINVYVNYKEHEELLYGEQINLNDLSEDDKKILTEGVQFKNMSELTEFTENLTS